MMQLLITVAGTLIVLHEGDSWSKDYASGGTAGPRTTRPGGQLVLGLCAQGDSWFKDYASGGTAGPRTTCPGGQLVLGLRAQGDSWS